VKSENASTNENLSSEAKNSQNGTEIEIKDEKISKSEAEAKEFDALATEKVKGYDKFVDMAQSFEQLLEAAMGTDEDTIVYFLHHPQFSDDGTSKPQTIGRMLDNQLNVEGLFPIVIECAIKDGRHVFVTENDGANIAKAPMGMLPAVMDNDLKAVDSAIREYWQLKPIVDAKPNVEVEG
jgi:hypothetical protein